MDEERTVVVRRRDDVSDLELVGGVERRELFLVDPDPSWADQYAAHEAHIRDALGDVAVAVEHIGSTSVPGLAAKPIVDVLVTVPDITAEEDYLDPLLAAGYVLRVREPGHRLVRTPQLDVHVHVLEPADVAAHDYLLLRDHLRLDPDDRRLYETTKRELVTRDWPDMNAYADAKTAVIEEIKARARSSRHRARTTEIRPVRLTDAEDMAAVQNAIFRAGLRSSPVDVALIHERYLGPEHAVACTVAEQDGRVVGFQSLKRAWPGNPYDVPEGWGIIGTHIHPDAGRGGLGRRLFAGSLAAARAVGLEHIDASIGAGNAPALAYYAAMGFRPYREGRDTVPHRFDVEPGHR